ncbi:5-carboxymethyl-2-hydroxymuconate isomerase [Streptomyces sp. 1114.5]|uniref:5-carboxymethyl-2-hydroxymuconate Delta-isomerase n=1 Tax=unclassified Streptomyces TaxID=2593676 RepID=UPI000BCA4C43|nr:MULTISPECIES: isomerase [unclassified Streptomyces]RKT18892.1 5-carboxymethyl-2-hydroxymuconate isomerase [Streptomyces sp. 1114.5]SOB85090.1 5-carboxymethyl-2-hydroxymuconate isomerase [Streptomyces sp. 1331.2]
MPQISVDYSSGLAGSFDRRALGLAINRLAVKTIDAKPEACKTLFRASDDFVVGEAEEPAAQVYVEFQIFPGRTPEAKAALSEGVLALLAEHVAPAAGTRLYTAVNISDIDRESYRSTTAAG